jgi:hypothetical protein
MGNLLVANEEDRQRRTKSGKPSKTKESNKKAIIDFFGAIKQDDPSTYPINFEHLTFNAFAAFLKTFKKTVTKRKSSTPSDTITIADTVTIRLCAGTFSNACSALSHLFTECNVDKGAHHSSRFLWRKLALYMKGLRRTGARERQKHGLRTSEGKDPMPFEAYRLLT